MPRLYLDWGNDEVNNAEFNHALELFNTAEQLGGPALQADIDAARAHCQMAWAQDLSDNQEFNASLDHVDLALEVDAGEALDTEIEDLRTEILQAFSRSSGTEARKLMTQTAKTLCTSYKTADLPIIGINPDEVRIFSADLSLPSKINATNPGNMHFVACITDNKVTIQTCAYQQGHTLYRQRIDRMIRLIDAATGKLYSSTNFSGSSPEVCQSMEMFYGTTKYKTGAPPADALFISWLSQFAK